MLEINDFFLPLRVIAGRTLRNIVENADSIIVQIIFCPHQIVTGDWNIN